MIKISIMYPNTKGTRFDMRYYLDVHMPLAVKALSPHPAFRGISVDRGVSGVVPGSDATYVAVCHILFETLEDFMAAFAPHAPLLQGDIPNYTDTTPIVQVNEVLISIGAK